MKNLIETEITPSQVTGLNQALGFLLGVELKELGVGNTWAVVRATNRLKPIVLDIQEMWKKVAQEFYEQNEQTEQTFYKKGLEEQAKKAEKEIENTKFNLKIPQIEFSKIEEVKGLTALHILQLEPILKVS
jgi:dissimilatory sulfite reductase (desulfoviridin) alpha/beta subunit